LIQYLEYADDVINSRTETDLQSAVSQPYVKAKGTGLVINENKTKNMIVSRNKEGWKNKQNRVIKDVSYERVDKFIYLGSLIAENNKIPEKLKKD
jgi:uncharacterized GH25 family protein